MKKIARKVLEIPLNIVDYFRRLYNRHFPVYEELEEQLWNESETMKGENIREGTDNWREMLFVFRWVQANIISIKRTSNELQKTIASNKLSEPKVFMWWEQGFNNAPALVKFLKENLENRHKKDSLIFLDKGNLSEFTNLPDDAWKKVTSPTKRSELVRLELLARHGGIWVDATCLCNINLLDYFSDFFNQNLDFFARYDNQIPRIRTWNLASRKSGYIVTTLLVSFRMLIKENEDFFNNKSYDCIRWLFESLYFVDNDFKKKWLEDSLMENVLPSYKFVRTTEKNKGRIEESAQHLSKMYMHKLTHKRPWNVNPENLSEAIKIASF